MSITTSTTLYIGPTTSVFAGKTILDFSFITLSRYQTISKIHIKLNLRIFSLVYTTSLSEVVLWLLHNTYPITEWFLHEMHITGQRKAILAYLSKKQNRRILIHSPSIPIYNAFLSRVATWKGYKYRGKRSVKSVCTFRNSIALPFHRHRDGAEVAVKFVRKQWFELSVGRENSMSIDVILDFVNLDHFTRGETFEFIATMKYFPSLIRARESRVLFPNAAIQTWWYGVMHCL